MSSNLQANMKLSLFFLLSVYYARATIVINVGDVIAEYRSLTCFGKVGEKKVFELSGDPTSDTNLKVTEGTVSEEKVVVGFEPTLAGVDAVPNAEISIAISDGDTKCAVSTQCIQRLEVDGTKYSIHIEQVGRGQKSMTCTDGIVQAEIVLTHVPTEAAAGALQVDKYGVIESGSFTLTANTTGCTIAAGTPRPLIPLFKMPDCTIAKQPCFQINDSPATSSPDTTSAGSSLAFAFSILETCFFARIML